MSQSNIPPTLSDIKRQLRDPKKKLDLEAQQFFNKLLIGIINEINREACKLFKDYKAVNNMKAVKNPGLELQIVYQLSRPRIGNVPIEDPAAFLVEIIKDKDSIKSLNYNIYSHIRQLPGYAQLILTFVDEKR